MKDLSVRASGISLLLGAGLASLTMLLHPSGGSLDHLMKIRQVLVFSHSLAIVCVPLLAFGFLGLTRHLVTDARWAEQGMIFAAFGLVAVLLAGTLNGLVLPRFATAYAGSEDKYVHMVVDYGRYFNASLTRIFMAFQVLAIVIWSLIMVFTRQFSVKLGYAGLVLGVAAVVLWFSGFNPVTVSGFSIFTGGLVAWLLMTGVGMVRGK